MNPQTAKAGLGKLTGFFNRKLTNDAVGFYVTEFRLVDDDVFQTAVDEACRAEKSFPTPRVLRDHINAAQRAKYASQYAHRVAEIFVNRPSDNDLMKESRATLRAMYEHGLYGDALVSKMISMEKTFPGYGWGKQGESLRRLLARDRKARAELASKRF